MGAGLIALRNFVITQLRGAAVKAALLAIFKSQAMGGFRGWVVKTIVKYFFDDIGEPIIKASFIEMKYTYDRVEGKIIIKKLEEAKHENNQGNYDHATDIIFE